MSARAQGDGARVCFEKSCSTCSAACGGSGARGGPQARAKPRLLVCSSRFLLGQFVGFLKRLWVAWLNGAGVLKGDISSRSGGLNAHREPVNVETGEEEGGGDEGKKAVVLTK